MLLAGRAQVDVGVEEGREGVQAAGVDLLEALAGGLAGRRQLGDLAVADDDVVLGIDAGHRVEHRRPAQDQVRALSGAHLHLGQAHAGCPIGVGRWAPLPCGGCGLHVAGGKQLVEDRHPHDQAGGDLLGDQRLRRVDHLAGELDAAVDRTGVHQHLAAAEPARVDLEVGRVLADRGHEALLHPLPLQAQGVDHVGLAEPVKRVGRPRSRAAPVRAGSAPAGRRRSAPPPSP